MHNDDDNVANQIRESRKNFFSFLKIFSFFRRIFNNIYGYRSSAIVVRQFTMLARVSTIKSLWLCLVIVANAIVRSKTADHSRLIVKPEVPKTPLLTASSASPETPTSSHQPKTIFSTIVSNLSKSDDSIDEMLHEIMAEKIDDDDEEKSSTTNIPNVSSMDHSSTTKIMDFRPSIHVGRIDDYENRKSTNTPFNNVQHVKFENSVSIDDNDDSDDIGRVRSPSIVTPLFHHGERANPLAGRSRNRVKFYDTDGRYNVPISIEYQVLPQTSHEHHHNDDENVEQDHNNVNYDVKNYQNVMPMFVDHDYVADVEKPILHYADGGSRPMTLSQPVYPGIFTDHKLQVDHYEPSVINVPIAHVKPSKFHGEVVTSMPPFRAQHYEYLAPVAGHEDVVKSEFLPHHAGSYQMVSQPIHESVIDKPESLLLMTSHRETAITRTRKFPYKFHHPGSGDHGTEYYYVSEGRHGYPVNERRVSPWKKILHLIGAFLPFGLLLAVLKPNVLRVNSQNSTQPGDVLSTLRDLPLEHKHGRLDSVLDTMPQDSCEDRFICELIVNGSKPHANLLQNILWDFTDKSPDNEAKKNGLHEIFVAVKQSNCSSIIC